MPKIAETDKLTNAASNKKAPILKVKHKNRAIEHLIS